MSSIAASCASKSCLFDSIQAILEKIKRWTALDVNGLSSLSVNEQIPQSLKAVEHFLIFSTVTNTRRFWPIVQSVARQVSEFRVKNSRLECKVGSCYIVEHFTPASGFLSAPSFILSLSPRSMCSCIRSSIIVVSS